MADARWRRADALLVLVAVLVAATCVRLGIWQLDRLERRRAQNAEIRAARAAPEIVLSGGRVPADSLAERPIRATGVYDETRQWLWLGRMHLGMPGVAFVTPLRLPGGEGLLVDRGWVAAPSVTSIERERYRAEPGTVTVTGYWRRAPRGPGDVDPTVLADSVPYPLLAGVVQLAPDGGSGTAGLTRLGPPPLDDGPHLGYAIQWFSFAVIVLVGSALLLRREWRARSGEG
jgi:surfeit locus 1 family protein